MNVTIKATVVVTPEHASDLPALHAYLVENKVGDGVVTLKETSVVVETVIQDTVV